MNKKIVEIIERIKQLDEDTLDTSDANNMIDYLMAKVYRNDEENIDYDTIEYLEYLRRKVAKSPCPNEARSVREILIANSHAASHNKYHAMQMNSIDFIRLYDGIIERIDNLTKLFIERKEHDERKQKEER